MVPMRALLPVASEDADIHSSYARDWLEPGGVRMNFVCSADGAATDDGLSRGLQTPGDNRVFAALRDLADVVLVGAGTVRAEGYGRITLSERRRGVRREHGLSEDLPIAVVSRALRLDPDAALFTDASRQARTVVLTCADTDAALRSRLGKVADVVVCGADRVDFVAARAALTERGYSRILGEGGPTLFAQMARAGAVDELCLSVSPLLAGPGARRIVAGQLWSGDPVGLSLTGLLEEDGALFCRYRVAST